MGWWRQHHWVTGIIQVEGRWNGGWWADLTIDGVGIMIKTGGWTAAAEQFVEIQKVFWGRVARRRVLVAVGEQERVDCVNSDLEVNVKCSGVK